MNDPVRGAMVRRRVAAALSSGAEQRRLAAEKVEVLHADSRQTKQWAGKPVVSVRRRQMLSQALRRITTSRTPDTTAAGVAWSSAVCVIAAVCNIRSDPSGELLRPACCVRPTTPAARWATRAGGLQNSGRQAAPEAVPVPSAD